MPLFIWKHGCYLHICWWYVIHRKYKWLIINVQVEINEFNEVILTKNTFYSESKKLLYKWILSTYQNIWQWMWLHNHHFIDKTSSNTKKAFIPIIFVENPILVLRKFGKKLDNFRIDNIGCVYAPCKIEMVESAIIDPLDIKFFGSVELWHKLFHIFLINQSIDGAVMYRSWHCHLI